MAAGEVGANPDAAVRRGRDAEDFASTFESLTSDFARLVERTMEDAKEPLCKAGYPDFLDLARPRMHQVQEHGSDLSGNIQAGGARAGATDDDSAAEYDDAVSLLARRVNERTLPYTTATDDGLQTGYGHNEPYPVLIGDRVL